LVGGRAGDLRARNSDSVALLAGEVGPAAAPRQLVACCFVQRDQGLLTALLARPEEFRSLLPDLLHVLSSFSGGPWWADADGAAPHTTLWQAPGESSLRVPVPEGWQVDGQVRQRDGRWGIQLDLTSDDHRLRCQWRQPLQPLFRDLTPVLRNLGWQEGDRYPTNVRENQLKILARLGPQDFLTRVWLAESPGHLDEAVVDELTPAPAVGELAGGQDAAGLVALLHGQSPTGARQGLYLVATGDAAPGGEPNCWQAAILAAEGPPGAAAEAMAVLRTVVEGTTVAASALPGAADGVREMILAARKVMAALPRATATRATHVDVLAIRNDQARGRLWLLPATGLTPWREAQQALVRGESVGSAVPELGADYWK